jgi:predicted ATPase/class 3 adenylate cyclase
MERVAQPSGTVTLVFTDIEGSTRLLAELGEARYLEALTQHREVVRGAFGRHGGYEVDTQGDSFFYAFQSAVAAVGAVEEAMEALEDGPIAIRVGVHTGQPGLDGRNYVGMDVHTAARVMAAGHGGQVLFSGATRALVKADIRELGEHRLKDFTEPIALFQLGGDRFPPLRTISNTNLPRPVSSFVGRERELGELVSIVRDQGARLVMLLGPGGTGKTRLAIETAAELVGDFAAGVFWVGLAPVRDPALVMDTIAQTLGAKVALAEHIGERELMLVLDNFEQVVGAAPDLVALLRACPKLRLLVTSRELMRVDGEAAYAVPALARREAVELFCARARVGPDETVAELCRGLDNLPLAIELAAARIGVLSPVQILDRVSQRLDLFRGGRDTDPRQQTLRATVAWSYDLLSPAERRLFARLSVFVGGLTLEAAVEVCDATLDDLESLVDKSLLRNTAGRFWMLETVREYAAELLEHSEEAERMKSRHAEYFLALFENHDETLLGPRVALEEYIVLVRGEEGNARRALARFRAGPDPVKIARLVSVLHALWMANPTEGLRALDNALATNTADEVRGRLLWAAGIVASAQGDVKAAEHFLEEAIPLAERLGNQRLLSQALTTLGGIVLFEGGYERAWALISESARIAGEIGDRRMLANTADSLAHIPLYQGDFEKAERMFGDALRLAREANAPSTEKNTLLNLGLALLGQGRLDDAASRLRESLTMPVVFKNSSDDTAIDALAAVVVAQGDATTAARLLGATADWRKKAGFSAQPYESALAERTASAACAALGQHTYRALLAEGARLDLDEAIELALTVESDA